MVVFHRLNVGLPPAGMTVIAQAHRKPLPSKRQLLDLTPKSSSFCSDPCVLSISGVTLIVSQSFLLKRQGQRFFCLQFLPQDKVVEFAKLKPKELLEETEKAVGDSTLYQKHMDLIEKRNSLKTFEMVRHLDC